MIRDSFGDIPEVSIESRPCRALFCWHDALMEDWPRCGPGSKCPWPGNCESLPSVSVTDFVRGSRYIELKGRLIIIWGEKAL